MPSASKETRLVSGLVLTICEPKVFCVSEFVPVLSLLQSSEKMSFAAAALFAVGSAGEGHRLGISSTFVSTRPIINRDIGYERGRDEHSAKSESPGPPKAEEGRKRANRDWPSIPTIMLDALRCADLTAIA